VTPLRAEIRTLFRMSAPVVGAQVGGMLIGVVDVVMLGHYSPQALAAVAVANVWVFGTIVLGEGIVRGIEPIVAQAHGARDGQRAALALQQGLVLALATSVPAALLWLATEPVLLAAGQDPELARTAQRYVWIQIPSIPFHAAWMALRGWLVGRGLMQAPMWVVIFANVWHALLNWGLIFGNFGLPELGVLGASISTCITRILNFLALVGLVRWLELHDGAWRPWSRAAFAWQGLRQAIALGLPYGLQIALEVWAFSGSTLVAGWIGVDAVASHQVVLNMASLSFMVPLGLAIAASARVGNLVGEGDADGVRRATRVALVLGAGVMAGFGALFVLLRDVLPALYTSERHLIDACAAILPIAAAFQIFDGVQVVSAGILRGMGRTQAPAVANALGYYAFGLPIGAWLAYGAGMGLAGVWWGLALGLAVVAGVLAIHSLRSGAVRV
jgi:MATE family multidrug resistance protein